MNFILVFAGGGLGCILRYLIGICIQRNTTSLPLATFISNVSACIIFAVVLWFIKEREDLEVNLRLLILTGFCGGLSTFSSFGYETFLMLKEQLYLFAALNIFLSTSLCILIFYLFKL